MQFVAKIKLLVQALAVAFCLSACGCRHLDSPLPTTANLVAGDSGRDDAESRGRAFTSATTPATTQAQTIAVYRLSTDDEAAPMYPAHSVCRFPHTECAIYIQPPRSPDEFLVAAPDEPPPWSDDANSASRWHDFRDEEPRQASNVIASDRDTGGRFHSILAATYDDVLQDYRNFYSRRTAVEFVAILAPAAVFANTNLDADFGNWYQTNVRSAATDRASAFFRPLGSGHYTIPVYVSAKFLGEYFDDRPGMALLGQFGDRATRALLVGAPPLLALQYATGGGRPAYIDQSYWRPFHSSHGASGHAFMGAVPFLTLARMTDDPWAKCFFYACSPWTGMTRINDNVHYLSQVWLGWWMAFLACEAVDRTENQKGPLTITPLVTPEMTGVGLIYQH